MTNNADMSVPPERLHHDEHNTGEWDRMSEDTDTCVRDWVAVLAKAAALGVIADDEPADAPYLNLETL